VAAWAGLGVRAGARLLEAPVRAAGVAVDQMAWMQADADAFAFFGGVPARLCRLPQPGADQPRRPAADQLRPRLGRARRVTRGDPGVERRLQILLHRLAVHSQTGRNLALRPARMPVDQDLGHVATLKLLPATGAPVHSFRREQLSDCEDHTDDATFAFPAGNYVSAKVAELRER